MRTRASTYALIVDDRAASGNDLQQFIAALSVVDRVVVACTTAEIESVVAQRGRPRVALVDLALHTARSAALVRQLQRCAPDTRMILVGPGDDPSAMLEAAQALGAHGCIGRMEPPRVHRNAVLAVLAGRTWFGEGGLPAGQSGSTAMTA